MSRINTNVSSLIAQKTLARSNSDLQTALTRLSTGLRINVGKDDPAGLIASENLRRDITSINRAIGNTERANQVIATADSALGQVASLLNDIRGLVTEAANSGALSDEQIAANQLQVDSSLEAIDRIAQTTTFQGRRLLDGSLSFLTQAGNGFSTVTDLQIDQANLGATGSVAVSVDITAAATQGQITNAVPSSAAAQFTFDSQTFTVTSSTVTAATIDIAVNSGPNATGTVTIDGHEFTVTASNTTLDDIDLDVGTADNLADGTLTLDGTDFAITANAGETFDDVDVEIVKTAQGATADTDADITIGDGTNSITFDLAVNPAGPNSGLINSDDIEVVVDDSLAQAAIEAATGNVGDDVYADFATGTNTLTIYVANDQAVVKADILTAINNAEIDGAAATGTFVTNQTGAAGGDFDVSGAGVLTTTGIGAGAELTREEAQASFDAASNLLTITLNSDRTSILATDIEAAITGLAEFASATPTGASGVITANVSAGTTADVITRDGVKASFAANTLTLTFDNQQSAIDIADVQNAITGLSEFSSATSSSTAGTIDGTTLSPTAFDVTDAFEKIEGAVASYNSGTNTITLTFDGSDNAVEATQVTAAIDALTDFSSTSTGSGTIDATGISAATGYSTLGQTQDLVVKVAGSLGSEVFSFQAGSTFQQIADAVNLVSDAIGVTASITGSNLELSSTAYGSNGFVDVEVISEGAGGTFESNLSASRASGTDIDARVNGVEANGDGNTLSINTATLDLSLTVDDGSSTDVNFTINGGGAVFQLGPDVVSNQQARVGITAIATGKLGGSTGRLYELRSGNDKALKTDATGAAEIVDDVITKVSELRGRLGAFQRTTLESNIVSLNDTLSNLSEAESSVRDADFAAESARLTRAQILVQSGTSVLSIANQNPQNVLSLLR